MVQLPLESCLQPTQVEYKGQSEDQDNEHIFFFLTEKQTKILLLNDGAYYCYCAYVLRISRYSDFQSPMLTNTGIFLRGLKLSGESRS